VAGNPNTSDSDQAPPKVERKAPDADQSTSDAGQSDYLIRTKPSGKWPNALETREKLPTAEI
jgi:hypothetical protein